MRPSDRKLKFLLALTLMAETLRADVTDLYDDPGPSGDGDQTMAVSGHPFFGAHPAECWRELLEIDRDIKHCKQQWAKSS